MYEEKLKGVKPLKNLGTICSALLPCAPEEICCQKLLLGGFSVSWRQCFIAVSATFPDVSVLTLLSLLQAHPRPKPSKAFFLEGKVFGVFSGTVLCIFLLRGLCICLLLQKVCNFFHHRAKAASP